MTLCCTGTCASDTERHEFKLALKEVWTSYDNEIIDVWLYSDDLYQIGVVDEVEINISENLVSSSVLNILDTHVQGEPSSKYVGKETVNVVPLDTVELPIASNNILLKIDVQGFEMAVLNGASQVLERSKLVSVEMSFVSVYDNNDVSWKDVVDFMDRKGFYLFGMQPAFTDNNTGQVYQVDGIFARK